MRVLFVILNKICTVNMQYFSTLSISLIYLYIFDFACRVADDNGIWLYIFCDYRSCAYYCPITDGKTIQDYRPCTYPTIITYFYPPPSDESECIYEYKSRSHEKQA